MTGQLDTQRQRHPDHEVEPTTGQLACISGHVLGMAAQELAILHPCERAEAGGKRLPRRRRGLQQHLDRLAARHAGHRQHQHQLIQRIEIMRSLE
jgi:hypothetical protein